MMVVMLIAGIGCLMAGLLAIGFGIPVKEFSFGNTLILAGAVAACTGLVILSLWAVVRELKGIAQRLGPGMPLDWKGTALQPTAATGSSRRQLAESGGFLFSRDQPVAEPGEPDAYPSAPSPAPWLDEAAARDRARNVAPPVPEPVETAPAPKPRRNLMFSSISRRERERAQARAADQAVTDPGPAPVDTPPVPEMSEPSPVPATFDDAWPKSERARSADAPLPRRGGRTPSTFSETSAGSASVERHPVAGGKEDQPPVTVLKSGVVDGMAYSLYSDGSIEAQMPEGMMRFASIDELRAHLDHRP